MTARSVAVLLAFLALGTCASATQMRSRVSVQMIGCVSCNSRSLGITLWDQAQGVEVRPAIVNWTHDGAVLSIPPGYYRVWLRTTACRGDGYLAVLTEHDRRFDLPVRCGSNKTIRLVDAMHGLEGTISGSVASISMRPADGSGDAIAGALSGGAYYFDEANCLHCVLELKLKNGKTARIAADLDRANCSVSRRDITDATARAGSSVIGSPFNSPETLTEGPAGSIWILDRLGNRVAVIDHAGRCRQYELPTPFSDAGDIIGTAESVWVSERRVGKIVRFRLDGSRAEFKIAPGTNHRNLRVALGGDGRIWFADNALVGAMSQTGAVSVYKDPQPVFWIRDLALGSDSRIWVVGLASSYAEGTPFVANVDSRGRWQRFPLQHEASSILVGKTGVWIAGDYDSLSFVDMNGNRKDLSLPVSSMNPKLYAVDGKDTLWFSDLYGNIIAHATPSGAIDAAYTDFGPPGISDMRVDGSETIWIAEPKAHVIEEFNKGFSLPPPGIHPKYLLFDSGGNLWYSDPVADVVGVIAKNRENKCYAFRLSRVKHCSFGRADLVK